MVGYIRYNLPYLSYKIRSSIDFIKIYRENIDRVFKLCDKDMMALENVPSSLKLFVECLAHAQKSLSLSPPVRRLIQQYYRSRWEDWM